MSHPRIDSVFTSQPFTCSTCDQVRTGLVNRIIGAKPDFPSHDPVDLLICGACAAAVKSDELDDSEAQHADYVRRYPEALE
jgi:hypothetical protein